MARALAARACVRHRHILAAISKPIIFSATVWCLSKATAATHRQRVMAASVMTVTAGEKNTPSAWRRMVRTCSRAAIAREHQAARIQLNISVLRLMMINDTVQLTHAAAQRGIGYATHARSFCLHHAPPSCALALCGAARAYIKRCRITTLSYRHHVISLFRVSSLFIS